MGKRLDIGGGGGGSFGVEDVGEGEAVAAAGEGGVGGEGGAEGGEGGEAGGEGDEGGDGGGDGDDISVGEGEGGDGGGKGDVLSVVMFRLFRASASRSVSGASSSASPWGERDRRADCPRLLAMSAALLLARVAVMAALTRFIGRGLALRVRSRPCAAGMSCWLESLWAVWVVSIGPDSPGGEGEGASAVNAVTPGVGVAGGKPPASLLLSSLRLALLARSLLLLPERWKWAWVVAAMGTSATESSPPSVVGRNQSVTSSVRPLDSKTSLAGIPALLQRTHTMYWLCAQGGWRGGLPEWVLECAAGRDVVLLPATGSRARVGSHDPPPLLDPPLAASAHVGKGEGGGEECRPVLLPSPSIRAPLMEGRGVGCGCHVW